LALHLPCFWHSSGGISLQDGLSISLSLFPVFLKASSHLDQLCTSRTPDIIEQVTNAFVSRLKA